MWIILVWIISTLCYMPLYFDKLGYEVPNTLIQMKYIFVVIPAIFSLMCVKRRTSIKKWIYNLFVQKMEFEAFAVCIVIALCGIVCTSILNRDVWNEASLTIQYIISFLNGDFRRNRMAWVLFRVNIKENKEICNIGC